MTSRGALTGTRVLDLSRMLPGPYCSMILADHGAEVVAIEDRRFLADGLFFGDLNRNKRHMALNLKTAEGLEIFFKLVATADVLLEGFRPGVVQRLGIDYPVLREKNPRLIYCSISGYGQSGPYVQRAGHDVNYLSVSGVLGLVAEQGRPPIIPGVQIADIAGGAMNGAIGILLALFARERTARGQYIDISMTDGMVGFLSLANVFARNEGRPPEAGNSLLSHRFACYNTYRTSDGRYLALGAVENRFWQGLCDYLARPEFGPLQYDEDRREEIIDYLRHTFAAKTLVEWEEELAELDVCASGVRTMEEVLTHPLFVSRDMVHHYTDGEGRRCHGFGIPVKLNETPGSIRTPPPGFGASGRHILGELGYEESEIRRLISAGVV